MRRIVFVLCVLLTTSSVAQHTYKYRIVLTDKNKNSYSLSKPEKFLSAKALERREKQGIAVDSTDLPVTQKYVKAISKQGVEIINTSRWNNTVLIQSSDTTIVDKISSLAFVKEVRKVWTSPDSISARDAKRKELVKNEYEKVESYYGKSAGQVEMLQVDKLHGAGFRGQGMTIAVLDAGYFNVDTIELLRNINIAGVRDFVNPYSDIYAEGAHGMKVLSCMAANAPNVLVGTAPEASYWLLRTEDDDSEQLVEQDYWATAIEFADSVGADVINTSLGYYRFDDKSTNITYRELDGRYSLASNSASMAASKGMVVCCSAGNAGAGIWKKITVPGDADNVLTVGAVNKNRLNAAFSSIGNTADGRMKPDVMAQGSSCAVIGVKGDVEFGNGTSYASPILCGAVTCLWQALPDLTAFQVMELVKQAGDRADFPDNIFGHGIPAFWKAYTEHSNR